MILNHESRSFVVGVSLALAVLLAFYLFHNKSEHRASVEQVSVEKSATVDRELIPLAHKFQEGDLLSVFGNFCRELSPAKNSCTYYEDFFFVSHVEVTGSALILDEGWFWPVRVIRGESIYIEGSEGWIKDHRNGLYLEKNLGPRPKPSFEAGDRVHLNFNFVPRKAPGVTEQRVYEDENVVIYGGLGQVSQVLIGPTLGSDERYWCRVKVISSAFRATYDYQLGLEGWIPCELTRAD